MITSFPRAPAPGTAVGTALCEDAAYGRVSPGSRPPFQPGSAHSSSPTARPPTQRRRIFRSGAPGSTCRRHPPAPAQPPPRRRPLYLQDLVQPLLAQARELLEQLRLLPLVVVGSRAPVRLLQHLEDRRPDGQVEDDGRGQQGAPVHHGAGGRERGRERGREGGRAGGARRAGRGGCPELRPWVPEAALSFPWHLCLPRRPPWLLSRPLPRSLRVFHTPLPLSSSPPPSLFSSLLRSAPPGCLLPPSFLPSLLSSDLNLVPSRFLPPHNPPAHAGLAAGVGRGKASGAPRGALPAPPRAAQLRRGAARPSPVRSPAGWESGGWVWPSPSPAREGAAWGKGSGAATSPLPALPARPLGARAGAAEVSPAPGAFTPPPTPEQGWSLRPEPCFPLRVFPWGEGRRRNVPQFYFTFPFVPPGSAEFLGRARRAAVPGPSEVLGQDGGGKGEQEPWGEKMGGCRRVSPLPRGGVHTCALQILRSRNCLSLPSCAF